MDGGKPGVARGQHDAVRRVTKPLQVVDGEGSVGKLDRRKLWVVGTELAVCGDVHQPCAVHYFADGVSAGLFAREDGGGLVELGEQANLSIPVFEVRPCNEDDVVVVVRS